MGNKNGDLMIAQKKRNDEYFTLYEDIAYEVPKYKQQLKGKRIICPCDWDESQDEQIVYCNGKYINPIESEEPMGTLREIDINKSQKIIKNINLVKCNFVKFLIAHAEDYQIKSITVSGYNPITEQGLKFQDVDFSKYDVAITNPPFSQIIDFFDVMFAYKMKFLVIGPQTAIGYKEAFKYIRTNQMWLGYAKQLSGFILSDGTEVLAKNPEGSVPRACKWFTNMDVTYRHDKMILTEKYTSERYPNYYNYDAINVSRTNEIPYDYEGKMGVPITFLQKYNPDQFEIIESNRETVKTIRWKGDKSNLWIEKDGKPWKCPFERIIIKNKDVYYDEN